MELERFPATAMPIEEHFDDLLLPDMSVAAPDPGNPPLESGRPKAADTVVADKAPAMA